jgi:hypothetical protein
MLSTDELTDAQWQIADAIARQLVLEGTDVNELRKATTYLRDRQDEPGAGKKFFDYLKTLVRHGNEIGHSKRTLGYYQSLDIVCSQYLNSYKDDAERMLYILSWAARLVQYYDKGVPTGEIEQPTVQSEREAEIQAVTQANKFEVGQDIEATVTAIRGNKVTYEILGSIKLTQKEPKLASKLSEGQILQVRIQDLREDGTLKRVRGNL